MWILLFASLLFAAQLDLNARTTSVCRLTLGVPKGALN